jgi:hypothetical protein
MREEDSLDALPASLMTPEEFVSHTIVIPVTPNPDPASAARRMVVDEGEQDQLGALRREVIRVAHRLQPGLGDTAKPILAERLIQNVLTMPVRRDVDCNRLPGGRMIAFVRQDALKTYPIREVVEEIHRREVDLAASNGQPVSPDNLAYYRNKPSPAVSAMVF